MATQRYNQEAFETFYGRAELVMGGQDPGVYQETALRDIGKRCLSDRAERRQKEWAERMGGLVVAPYNQPDHAAQQPPSEEVF